MALAVLAAGNHAMWRDEVQAFLIARESASLPTLIQNLRFDGHPILWYLLIWPSTRWSGDPDAMKPVTIALSTLAVAVFLWRGPWTRLEKALWPFGYHVLFEYTVRSRSYAAGMALTMLLCALWPQRDRRIVLVGLVLGLMANVHLHFGVLAAAAGIAILAERIARGGMHSVLVSPARDVPAVAIFAALSLFAAVVAAPPSQGDWSAPKDIPWSVLLFPAAQIMVPPAMQPGLGIPPLLLSPLLILGVVLGFGVLAGSLWAVRRSVAAFAFLAAVLVVLFTMFRLMYSPSIQHAGVLVLAITAAHWFLRTDQGVAAGQPGWPLRFFHAMLVCQALSGLGMLGYYALHPHAHGRTAAAFIRDHGWAGQPVAGFGDSLTPVCGYLQAPACYYIERDRWSAQTVYDAVKGRTPEAATVTRDTYDALIARTAALGPSVTLLIPDRWPDWAEIMAAHGFRKVASLNGAVVDNYEIYRRGD